MARNLRLAVRLRLAFAVLLILLTVISAVSILRMADFDQRVGALAHDWFPKTAMAKDIAFRMMDNARIVRNVVLVPDERSRASNKAAYDENSERIAELFGQPACVNRVVASGQAAT